MERGFPVRFMSAWLAGFSAAILLVVLGGRGGESNLAFVAAWGAIYAVPLGLVTVLPLAILAWKRRFPSWLVLVGGVAVGSLPGILQYLYGILSSHQPPLAGTGNRLYLLAAVVGSVVGSCLYFYAVQKRWQAG